MVRTSGLVLVTTTLKVKLPPGGGPARGVAVLSTWMIGRGVTTDASSGAPHGLVAAG